VFASGAQQCAWALDDGRSDGSLFPEPPIQPWRGVPVDPRLQQFMRNMLDDLTRPAAPAGLAVRLDGNRLLVQITSSADPRTLGFVAGIRVGDHWQPLCHGTSRCAGLVLPGSGPVTVGVVAVDEWHRHSSATFAAIRR
jgi:hypothetical protein